MLASMNPRSAIFRALMVNPGSWVSLDEQRVYARNLEVPSGGGVGTARAIARAYSVFATGGRELGLRQDTLQALTAPAIPSAHGFYDEGVKGESPVFAGLHEDVPELAVRTRAARSARPARVGRLASPTLKPARPTPMSPIAWAE